MAGAYPSESLLSLPPCQLHVLTSVPASLDPSTWAKPALTGYAPAFAFPELLQDMRPNGMLWQWQGLVILPGPVNVQAWGVTSGGDGLSFGDLAAGLVSGPLSVIAQTLFQRWQP